MSIKKIAHKFQEWRRYRASVRALCSLSNRELDDLGLSRGEIEFVAKKAARF